MVVPPGRCIVFDNAQTSGHTQMYDEGAGVGADQQVFSAARKLSYTDMFYSPGKLSGNRPAQSGLAHDEPLNFLAANMRLDTAAGGFDLGEFRHVNGPVAY